VSSEKLESKSRNRTILRPILVIPELNMRLVWVVPERMRLVSIVPELILDQCILLQNYWANAFCSRTNTHKIKVGRVCVLP